MLLSLLKEKLSSSEKIDKDIELKKGYAGDMLSDVLANAKNCDIWFTIKNQTNIIAIAEVKNIKVAVVCGGNNIDSKTYALANEHGVTVLTTKLNLIDAVEKYLTSK